MPAPEPASLPFRARVRAPDWAIAVRSDVGLVRSRLEDAWAVLPAARLGAVSATALAVFDGLGGMAFGQEAAWAAADHLGETLAKTARPEDVLGALNAWVRSTNGATTAVVALVSMGADPGSGAILSVGDSAAYALRDGAARLLVPKDSDGPSVVTRYLGDSDVDAHVTPLRVGRGEAVLLCSDGVDGVVGEASLRRVLEAPDLGEALENLFAEILENGAPDNATVVVARRVA